MPVHILPARERIAVTTIVVVGGCDELIAPVHTLVVAPVNKLRHLVLDLVLALSNGLRRDAGAFFWVENVDSENE